MTRGRGLGPVGRRHFPPVALFGERLIPTARQTLEANRTNYESGKATFLELVLSERNLFDLESMAREHRASYEMAVAELEALVGTGPKQSTQHPTDTREGAGT